HVAGAAFTRAVLLKREGDAVTLIPTLRALAPSLAADLDRIAHAAPADRHVAIVLFLARTPGMHVRVAGIEEDNEVVDREPSRSFDHLFRYQSWWCRVGAPTDESGRQKDVASLAYPGGKVGFPGFLTAAERAAVEREIGDLGSVPPG